MDAFEQRGPSLSLPRVAAFRGLFQRDGPSFHGGCAPAPVSRRAEAISFLQRCAAPSSLAAIQVNTRCCDDQLTPRFFGALRLRRFLRSVTRDDDVDALRITCQRAGFKMLAASPVAQPRSRR